MKKNLPTFLWLSVFITVSATSPGVPAQKSNVALPMIAAAAVPLYPPLARVANVQGVVHVRITTDGHRVIATHVEDGHKLLAAAAEENARTWEFATHESTSFTVTYQYKLDVKLKNDPDNPIIILRFPTEVEISSSPMPPLDTAGVSATHEAGHAQGTTAIAKKP